MSYQIPSNSLPNKVLYLDSRDASRYLAQNSDGYDLSSYFQYILNESIEIPGNQRALISLNSATIPYSFYTIREGINDLIPLKAVNDDTAAEGTCDFVIPKGNYTAYTLGTYLSDNIPLATGNANWNSLFKTKFTLSLQFSQDTGKFTYTLSSATIDNLSLYIDFSDITNVDKFSNIETGFRLRNVRIQYQKTASPVLTTQSDNVIDISGSIHGVYIRTNLVQSGTLDSQNGTFSNILARLPINVASGGIIFATPTTLPSRNIVDLRSINSLTIRLTDERNRIVDLNGLDFQIAISVEFVYAKKPQLVRTGALTAGGSGDSYDVQPKNIKEQIAQFKARKQLQEEEDNRRGPGRPRRVGRPRMKRNVGRPKGS